MTILGHIHMCWNIFKDIIIADFSEVYIISYYYQKSKIKSSKNGRWVFNTTTTTTTTNNNNNKKKKKLK